MSRGRARNKSHRSRSKQKLSRPALDVTEYPWETHVDNSQEDKDRVPKVSLDCFFLGADQVRRITRNSAAKMSTKQLRRKLETAGFGLWEQG